MTLSTPIIAGLVSVALSAWASYGLTSLYYDDKISEIRLEQAQAAQQAQVENRDTEREQFDRANDIAKLHEVQTQRQKIVTHFIDRKEIEYAQSDPLVIDRFTINGLWVFNHNVSARGRVPETTEAASEPNGSTGAVGDAEALGVVTRNYERYHECANRLKLLQQWADGLEQLDAE